ncbi:MAG TPA: hypothetical protein VH560_02495, partial [Polyangia bacterium]|nr:hypothetical protein [Polyangia bacterium]
MSDRRIGRILVSLGISGALTAWSVVARANEASPPSAATCAHLRLVDGDADARELLGELGDILSADLPFLDVAMASAPDVDRV